MLSTALAPNQDDTCNTESTEASPDDVDVFLMSPFGSNSTYHRCTLSQSRTPIISDCDFGPEDGLPSEPAKEFYSLESVSAEGMFIDSYDWLVFEFRPSGLQLDRLVLFYYCTTTSPSDLFIGVIGHFVTAVNVCNTTRLMNLTLPLNNAAVGESLFIRVFLAQDIPFEIHLSEVQFFSDNITGKRRSLI